VEARALLYVAGQRRWHVVRCSSARGRSSGGRPKGARGVTRRWRRSRLFGRCRHLLSRPARVVSRAELETARGPRGLGPATGDVAARGPRPSFARAVVSTGPPTPLTADQQSRRAGNSAGRPAPRDAHADPGRERGSGEKDAGGLLSSDVLVNRRRISGHRLPFLLVPEDSRSRQKDRRPELWRGVRVFGDRSSRCAEIGTVRTGDGGGKRGRDAWRGPWSGAAGERRVAVGTPMPMVFGSPSSGSGRSLGDEGTSRLQSKATHSRPLLPPARGPWRGMARGRLRGLLRVIMAAPRASLEDAASCDDGEGWWRFEASPHSIGGARGPLPKPVEVVVDRPCATRKRVPGRPAGYSLERRPRQTAGGAAPWPRSRGR